MMKKKNTVLIVCIAAAAALILGLKLLHTLASTPPDIEEIQSTFNENADDINTLMAFFGESGFDEIHIRDDSGMIWADFQDVRIQDEAVLSAISRLLSKGNYLQIFKNEYCISFLQWRFSMDVGGGLLYSTNLTESIDRELITQLTPLADEGWYYYISDYNEWRIGTRPDIG